MSGSPLTRSESRARRRGPDHWSGLLPVPWSAIGPFAAPEARLPRRTSFPRPGLSSDLHRTRAVSSSELGSFRVEWEVVGAGSSTCLACPLLGLN